MALQQSLFVARPSRPTLTYINTYFSNSSASSYNFTVTSNESGLIIVTFAGQSSDATARTLSSHTIDGSAGTEVVTKAQNWSSGTGMTAGIVSRRITSTSNFSVNITFSGNVSGCRIGVWRLTNNTSDTAITTGSAGATGGSTLPDITLNNLRLNNVVVAVIGIGGYNKTVSWTGNAVSRYNANQGNTAGSSGADEWVITDGNFTIGGSVSSDDTDASAAAAWI